MASRIPEPLRDVIANAPYAVAILDRQLHYLSVSRQWIAQFKLDPNLDTASNPQLYPLKGNDWELIFRELLEGEKRECENEYLLDIDGQVQRIACVVQSWLEDTGAIGGCVIYVKPRQEVQFTDAELKEAMLENSEQIRISEEQFRGAFEYSAIGMALFTMDGRCKRANQSLCDMLGYKQKELIKLRFDDITYPADLPRNILLMNELIDGTRDSYHMEKRYLHKSGRPVWVLLGVSILRDADRMPIHFISQIQDITKIKEAEHALAISEDKYRKIFENTQDIYYRTDQNGIVTEISPSVERFGGYKRESVIGKPATDFYYYADDREKLLKALRQDNEVTDFEVKLKSNTSALLYGSVNARLIVEDGLIIGSEGSIRDISFRKLQEIELMSLNTELKALINHREKMLSVIGHDLRNPVAASLRLAELALMEVKEVKKDELLEYLFKMKTGLFNANELLEDLLRWAKNQFDSITFNPVVIADIQSHLQTCLEVMKPMADAKEITLLQSVEPGLEIYADQDMLDTIIRNLVSNAIKFTKCGSITISIGNYYLANHVLFSVADTGNGISENVMNTLFNKNTNYTSSGTSGERGTGLGLELCRDFVEKHQGEIWVESSEGLGSVFYFTIPIQRLIY